MFNKLKPITSFKKIKNVKIIGNKFVYFYSIASRKFNKVDSTETGRIVTDHSLP